MNKRSANRSRTAVQVLVTAPHREIDAPIVHLELEVPRRVSEVESVYRSSLVTGLGDLLHLKRLARVVIHSAQQNECDLVAASFDRLDDIASAECRFALSRRELDQIFSWIKPVTPHLRLDRV